VSGIFHAAVEVLQPKITSFAAKIEVLQSPVESSALPVAILQLGGVLSRCGLGRVPVGFK
jgi:hypothetical protein